MKSGNMIPLFWPYIPKRVIKDLQKTLSTRWIGQGPKVEEFEYKIGKKFGIKYPLFVNSGTSALELAYDLVGIGKGDEIITTPMTCTATNIPLLRRKAKLVWADILPDTLCINPKDIQSKITSKTKAIINVNLGGIRSDIGKFSVPVITDSAQAIGFTNGDYVIYSFQAIKHFTTGDGGLLCLPDKKTYERAKRLRWFGIDREQKKRSDWQAYKHREMTFDIVEPGFKYQPTDIDATFGIAGLAEYDRILAKRKKIFEYYRDNLPINIKLINDKHNVYWLATILVENRDECAEKLKQKGIETNLVQVRNDIFTIFGGKRQNLPVMNFIEDHYISIPINMKMTMKDAKYIVRAIHSIC